MNFSEIQVKIRFWKKGKAGIYILKVKCGNGNAMKFWNIQSSFSVRKRRTTLACNFVDGNPEPENWQKNSRQKSLRFILRFWSEYSSGRIQFHSTAQQTRGSRQNFIALFGAQYLYRTFTNGELLRLWLIGSSPMYSLKWLSHCGEHF